jgi:RNA-directed DNA polymerase
MQTELFNISAHAQSCQVLSDLFTAYYLARKNKRNTINALRFEKHYEHGLFQLHEEIMAYQYNPKPSICFVVNKPVKREIFAADFRDRVVHHLLYNYLSPIFEKRFIHDSYSCRKGKGTHYGIRRIDHFMRSCSENYKNNCYILKLDIKGYFMAMDRRLLYSKVKSTLTKQSNPLDFDLPLVLYLLQKVIFNDPTENCIVKGQKIDWNGLPPAKSLFNAPAGKGLPIGNLTSQLFGNVYLNGFDHYVKRDLGIRYYGRYVDDFVLIHPDKQYLIRCIRYIKEYLKNKLMLDLHPDKVYLQPFSKGVKYLGAVILPHRIYLANRTKGNFYESIQKHSAVARDHKPDIEERKSFSSSMNSYLGIAKHYKTYKLRKRMLFNNLSGWWWNCAYLTGGYAKFVLKNN